LRYAKSSPEHGADLEAFVARVRAFRPRREALEASSSP
jgi:hypothetical protein